MNSTLEAAIHLGNDHDANLRHVKNSFWRSAGQLFRETERFISGQTETTGISLIDSQDSRFKVVIDRLVAQSSLSICHCQGLRFFPIRCCVLGRRDNSVESWKNQIQWYSEDNYLNEKNRIDGQLVEFEWQIFPGITAEAILNDSTDDG